MRINYLLKWLDSPVPGRRRKALEQLTKHAIRTPSQIDQIYPRIKQLIKDSDWSVRSTLLKSLTELALVKQEILPETLEVIKESINDEFPNVRSTAIFCLAKLIAKYKDLAQDTHTIDTALERLRDENNNVKEAALRLLLELSRINSDILQKKFNEVYGLANHEIASIRKRVLEVFNENFENIPEDQLANVISLYYEKLKDPDYFVREYALKGFCRLVELDKVKIDETLIREVRKRLRDLYIPVKRATIELIRKILDKNIFYADNFLDIISNEILLKEKSLNFKLEVLRLLYDYIDKIPQGIIHKHNIPRSLDKLEKATVEKSAKREEIKKLARVILEQKLGYTVEIRRKKFGEPDQKEK
ncbi:MAG: sister chromatid cohesion protein PDS5 [Candidatus Njordarchaeales archaeon]